MLSRRRLIVRAAAGVLTAVLAACAAAIRSVSPSPTAPPSPDPQTPTPSPSPVGPTLRERIAQMLLVGFRGLTVEEAEPTRALIADGSLGGILLFSLDNPTGGPRNVESPDQLRALVAGLADAAPASGLLVAIDQEGGRVARLGPPHDFPPTTSASDLGRGPVEATRAAGEAIAETLASVGINLNLAPVVDLAINPENPIVAAVGRSFSAAPEIVVAHAAAFIDAQRATGISCAIKHFPGQGSASADTHLGVVDVTDAWTDRELEPFRALVADELVDAVLTAHIFNAHLDPDHPATLSRATIGLLRDEVGFDGPVISDDLQMGAIRDAYGYPEAVALALEAGIDLLLIANQQVYEPDVVLQTIGIVERLVAEGRIGEDRIDDSYQRLLRLRG